MADPDWDDVTEMISFYIDVPDTHEAQGATLIARIESARNDTEGYWAQEARGSLLDFEDAVAEVLTEEFLTDMLESLLHQLGVAISSAHAGINVDMVWADTYDYCIDNAKTVKTRNFTFGTPSLPSANTGDGEVIRITVDEQGEPLEGWWPDTYTLTCTRAAGQTGEKHVEYFKLEGTDKAGTELSRTGTGPILENIRSLNARDSKRYVKNPSFNTYSGAASPPANPTTVSGWTVGSAWTNFNISTAITYRSTPGESINASLEFIADDYIKQDLIDQAKARIDPDTPYLCGPAVYRADTATGTLTIRLSDATLSGGISRAVDVSTLADDAWTRCWIIATAGQNNWAKNFARVNDLTLSFTMASLATGTVHLDDTVFHELVRVGAASDSRRGRGAMGQYLAVVGAPTPWVKEDSASWTDSAVGAVNQEYFCRAERGYLPSDANPSWADK